jgi:hypothetical protein
MKNAELLTSLISCSLFLLNYNKYPEWFGKLKLSPPWGVLGSSIALNAGSSVSLPNDIIRWQLNDLPKLID